MMNIKKKWASYAGPYDERQLLETYKVRNKGFIAMILSAAAVTYYMVCLSNALQQKAAELAEAGIDLGFNLGSVMTGPLFLLDATLLATCISVAVVLARKGISETNRFGSQDKFPWGYYLLWSAGGAGCAAVVAVLGRLAATLQIFGSIVDSAAFYAGFATGIFLPVFIGCMIAFGVVFRSSKKHREALEAELEED